MNSYTLEQLRTEGPPVAMAMLLRCLQSGEQFVTYGDIGKELKRQMGLTTNIFSVHIGHVAGSLIDLILQHDPKAPLINILITRASGIPGSGAAGYIANKYRDQSFINWNKVPLEKKISILDKERKKIFKYGKWGSLNKELFADSNIILSPILKDSEEDYAGNSYRGPSESDEHKKLKEWIATQAKDFGFAPDFKIGVTEHRLSSGDEVDVLFNDGNHFRCIEVKSIRSSDEDIKRGIYQCVKYRAVKEAEIYPYDAKVEAMLIVERDLPPELKERARMLKIKLVKVSLNQ